MMFAVRGIMVALGFFGVFYCLLSLVVVCMWRCVSFLCRDSGIQLARQLFAVRIFPLAASALLTVAFALPAFFLLEPGAIDEDMGTLVFGVCTLSILGAGIFRVWTARADASRMIADWLEGAHALEADGRPWQIKPGLPPLLLYGVFAPRVLVSETAVSLLTPNELRVAVRHEIGHLRSRDNLKKLILHGAPFPGMAGLERTWQAAVEFAADEAAVSTSEDAIDLAAALIKLCDLAPLQDAPAFTTGLMDLAALVKVRVERLLGWNKTKSRVEHLHRWWSLPVLILPGLYTAVHYHQALLFTHRATEWFIH
jgi:Zn-dependent protease with chaperone function